MFHRLARLLAAAGIALAVLMLVACGDAGSDRANPTEGPARGFLMGFSSIPRELNSDAYADAFRLAGEHGDLVLIQRTPPWGDFLPGGEVSDETAATTAAEKDAIDSEDLRLFFAIDPTDGATGRDRLAAMPDALAGSDFSDSRVREAFVAYASYVALNYKPDYMALGVEVNLYYNKRKEGFADFQSLYAEAYEAVKSISPRTQITATFQYEDLRGILPGEDAHFPDWSLVKQLDDRLDFVGISTHPSMAFASADDIPSDYYTDLAAFTDKPIAIAEMGYASVAGADSVYSGSEEDQATFLRRALDQAQEMAMPFVVWFAGWDPSYTRDGAYSPFAHIGLLRGDNSEKPAWRYWAEAARRPYDRDAALAALNDDPNASR